MRARDMEVEGGSLTVAGHKYGRNEIKKISGYVMQQGDKFCLFVLGRLSHQVRITSRYSL